VEEAELHRPPRPVLSTPLDAAWVEAIALLVVELMRHDSAPERRQLVDAATLAAELGVTRSWIYEHRDELGAVRLGAGTKPRLRFDIETARRTLLRPRDEAPGSPRTDGDTYAETRRTTRRQRRATAAGSVLVSRPRRTA
jgi:hypothetical protein